MNPSIDPNIKINPSSELRDILSTMKNKGIEGVPEYSENDDLSLENIKWIFDNRRHFPTNVRFHQLLKKCDITLPMPIYPPRSPELENRIQRLKAEEEHRKYNEMTKDVNRKQINSSENTSFASQMKEVDRYLIVIFQFVMSVATAFTFGYLAPYYLYGRSDVGFRLLLGIVFGFIVAIADLYFVIKFLLETEGLITRPKAD